MAKDPSKYDKLTGQRKIGYGAGALAGAAAGATAGGAWKRSLKGAAVGAGAGALYGLAKIKGRNDSNKKNKRFAAAGYVVGKRAERARLVRALEAARDKTKGSKAEISKTAMEPTVYQKFADEMNRVAKEDSSEKTAGEFVRRKQSKSVRFSKSISRKRYANKGFGGSVRRKKL